MAADGVTIADAWHEDGAMYGNRRHQRGPVLGNVWGGQASPFGSSTHALANNRPAEEFPITKAKQASTRKRPATAQSHQSDLHDLGWSPVHSPWSAFDGVEAVQKRQEWGETITRDERLPSGVRISSP